MLDLMVKEKVVKPLLINSIYQATEGEGIHLGNPQIFVRFQGCAIGCINCDSRETWPFLEETGSSVEAVVQQIQSLSQTNRYPIKRVSITGGDPLHPRFHDGLLELIRQLKALDFWINIEASGVRIVDSVFELVDFISFDFKTLSTNVQTRPEMIVRVAQNFGDKLQVKSVIESDEDFFQVVKVYQFVEKELNSVYFAWCLTPAYNEREEFPLRRFKRVIELNQQWGGIFRVVGQQHKWLYGPDSLRV